MKSFFTDFEPKKTLKPKSASEVQEIIKKANTKKTGSAYPGIRLKNRRLLNVAAVLILIIVIASGLFISLPKNKAEKTTAVQENSDTEYMAVSGKKEEPTEYDIPVSFESDGKIGNIFNCTIFTQKSCSCAFTSNNRRAAFCTKTI